MRLLVSLASALAAFELVHAWGPFPEHPSPPSPAKPIKSRLPGPYDTFVNHFSADRSGTDVVLQNRIADLYSNTSVTVTQEWSFNLVRFANEQPHKVVLRELEDITFLRQYIYLPARRRRDGDGNLMETDKFAGYKVAYGDHELIAIVASWSEGYSMVTQWHFIGNEHVAKQLIHETSAYCSAIRDAVLVFDQSQWQPDYELWKAVQKASWEDVILDEDFKKRLVSDYRSFFKSEETYRNLDVPWKRGLIFLGPPGNGKTISLKAIMKDVKVPALYVKSFHSWGGDEVGIREIFTRARAEAPCVLVLEDLDSLIDDNNRSFFLNEVDGLEDNDGLLLIGTTNHFDRLDPALSSRPSRFDRKYSFPDPKTTERRQYAIYWQNKLRSNKDINFPDDLVDKIAEKTEKFSFAYLKEAFISTLLTLAGRDENHQGEDFPEVLLDQIHRLRQQLDEDQDTSMAGSWGRASFSPKSAESGRGGRGTVMEDDRSAQMPMRAVAMSSPMKRSASGSGQCVQVDVVNGEIVRP